MTKQDNTQLATLTPAGEDIIALGELDTRFKERYGPALNKYARLLPTKRDFDVLLDTLLDNEETANLATSLSKVLNQTQGDKIGMFSSEEQTVFPELRVFHGPGNDPNKPETTQVGHFYLNTNEIVGPEFVGAVIAILKGRTMWGNKDAGDKTNAPICQSMDRLIGSTCGECVTCPDKPWRDGEKTRCSDDVVAFMLSRDMSKLVMVRFAKTSTKAGHQLYRNISVGTSTWSKWWKLSLSKQTKDAYKWFNIEISPPGDTQEDRYTPEAIDGFCKALSVNLATSIVLPGIARSYVQSKAEENNEAGSSPAGGQSSVDENTDFGGGDTNGVDTDEKYGEMPEEAPEEAPDEKSNV